MRIGILTSSRADYGIYYPLLDALRSDPYFSLSILAFGTHLSKKHGYTLNGIEEDGFHISHAMETYPDNDTPGAITASMAKTMLQFAPVWKESKFDLVFCLGDRYEMFAACASAIPFNITLAHLHGGETTLGAIDDCFRHAITHMAEFHFTAAEVYRQRVVQLKGSEKNVFNTGSLSIDNLKHMNLLSITQIKEQFGIDLSKPTILITFHPETVSFEKNELYIHELISALEVITDYQLVITMPNADTMGNLIRKKLNTFIAQTPRANGIESFGMLGYLSCMKHCSFMLGNTSSGFIEASYFPKYVINLGDRQKGRIVTPNIKSIPIRKDDIVTAVLQFEKIAWDGPIQIYGNGDTASKIVEKLKASHD